MSKMMFVRAIFHWKLRENIMRTNARSRSRVRGHWEENKTMWYEQTMFYCDSCGMLIPKKQFIVEDNSVSHRFCGMDCARLDEKVRRLNKQQSSHIRESDGRLLGSDVLATEPAGRQ